VWEIPPANASAVEHAAWFERKANIFDALATEDSRPDGEAARIAENARARAEELRRHQCDAGQQLPAHPDQRAPADRADP
jgi:hypothetical protein